MQQNEKARLKFDQLLIESGRKDQDKKVNLSEEIGISRSRILHAYRSCLLGSHHHQVWIFQIKIIGMCRLTIVEEQSYTAHAYAH